jgi:hypothetical protein
MKMWLIQTRRLHRAADSIGSTDEMCFFSFVGKVILSIELVLSFHQVAQMADNGELTKRCMMADERLMIPGASARNRGNDKLSIGFALDRKPASGGVADPARSSLIGFFRSCELMTIKSSWRMAVMLLLAMT